MVADAGRKELFSFSQVLWFYCFFSDLSCVNVSTDFSIPEIFSQITFRRASFRARMSEWNVDLDRCLDFASLNW